MPPKIEGAGDVHGARRRDPLTCDHLVTYRSTNGTRRRTSTVPSRRSPVPSRRPLDLLSRDGRTVDRAGVRAVDDALRGDETPHRCSRRRTSWSVRRSGGEAPLPQPVPHPDDARPLDRQVPRARRQRAHRPQERTGEIIMRTTTRSAAPPGTAPHAQRQAVTVYIKARPRAIWHPRLPIPSGRTVRIHRLHHYDLRPAGRSTSSRAGVPSRGRGGRLSVPGHARRRRSHRSRGATQAGDHVADADGPDDGGRTDDDDHLRDRAVRRLLLAHRRPRRHRRTRHRRPWSAATARPIPMVAAAGTRGSSAISSRCSRPVPSSPADRRTLPAMSMSGTGAGTSTSQGRVRTGRRPSGARC